jgi:hypothetical protein
MAEYTKRLNSEILNSIQLEIISGATFLRFFIYIALCISESGRLNVNRSC